MPEPVVTKKLSDATILTSQGVLKEDLFLTGISVGVRDNTYVMGECNQKTDRYLHGQSRHG